MKIKLYYMLLITVFLISGTHPAVAATKTGKPVSNKETPKLKLSNYYIPLSPSSIQSSTCINIVKNLSGRHFRSIKINDDLSEKLFQRYIEELDPNKAHFLASDIAQFESFKYVFDDALKQGDLSQAFAIFNQYHKRTIERLIFMIKKLECCTDSLDFSKKEFIETDTDKINWPQSNTELHDIWRKRLKNDILNRQLSETDTKEIHTLLGKRYKNQLNRTRQMKSEDAFRLFMNAFTQIYDPHTQYFSPRISEDFNIRMSLSLEGIGALLQSDNEYTKVLKVIHGGPAELSNLLKAGDRIIGVGQGDKGEIADVIGWRLDDVVQLIRGPKNTVVRLRIIPATAATDQENRLISITRNTVKLEEQDASSEIHEVKKDKKNYKIGIITIPTFYIDFNAQQEGVPDFKSTTRDVKRLLTELKKENVDGVIVDLRENGGGALQEASNLTGLFIETGPIVLVKQIRNRLSAYTDNDPEIAYNGPLVVMVNRMSASASEIFAGAIQDYQ